MISRLITLIIKEFKAIWKDPRSRIVVTIVPLFLLVLFANAVTMDVKNIDMVVLDNSRSLYSRDLISHFSGSTLFKSVTTVDTPEEVKQRMDLQQASVALEIPPDFSNAIINKAGTTVQIITDGRQTNSAAITAGYVSQIIQEYSTTLSVGGNTTVAPVEMVVRNWFNPNLEYQLYSIVSLLAILPMVTVLLLTALSIAREKETGTFEQLIVSPLSSSEIMIGKSLPALLISLLLSSIMLIIAVVFFNLPMEGPFYIYLMANFFALMALIGIGLFISSLCKTQQQAMLGAFSFQMPSVLLSGFISPIDDMPVFLQYLTYINPIRYFLTLTNGILMRDVDGYFIIQNLIPLMIIAIITLSIATWMFKSRLE